MSLTMARRVD